MFQLLALFCSALVVGFICCDQHQLSLVKVQVLPSKISMFGHPSTNPMHINFLRLTTKQHWQLCEPWHAPLRLSKHSSTYPRDKPSYPKICVAMGWGLVFTPASVQDAYHQLICPCHGSTAQLVQRGQFGSRWWHCMRTHVQHLTIHLWPT